MMVATGENGHKAIELVGHLSQLLSGFFVFGHCMIDEYARKIEYSSKPANNSNDV